MALRNIRVNGDPILRKRSREITDINERIRQLADDMVETMKEAEGIGLAAPQVGVLRRIIVIDIGEDDPITMINPMIIVAEGSQVSLEGCLSVPGVNDKVERPSLVKVKYTDLDGEKQILEGTELAARAICHEVDHLDGILFIDKIYTKEND